MTILDDLKTYLETYPALVANAPLNIDTLGKTPTEYSIVPTPGTKILERYINNGSLREYSFALQSMEYTADNLARLENNGFYETFAEWLEDQNDAGILPTLDAGKTAETIEALGHGSLFEFGESSTGIYQIQCRLVYEQDP